MSEPNTMFDFDPIAGGYDRCNHLFSLGIDRRWRRRVVGLLRPQMHQKVLDVATGTGDLVYAFCRYSLVRELTGVDISSAMLSCAQEKQIRLCGKPWLRNRTLAWHMADAAATGLASGQYDIITCAFGIRNLPDRAAALAEMRRLIKPSGRLCILEFSLPASPVLRGPYAWYLGHIMPAAGRWIVGSRRPLQYLAQSIRHWHTEINFSGELAEHGFSLIHKIPLTGGIATCWLAKPR